MSFSINATGDPYEVHQQVQQQMEEQVPTAGRFVPQDEFLRAVEDSVHALVHSTSSGQHLAVTGSGHVEPDGQGQAGISFSTFIPAFVTEEEPSAADDEPSEGADGGEAPGDAEPSEAAGAGEAANAIADEVLAE